MWPTIWLQEASLNHSCHKSKFYGKTNGSGLAMFLKDNLIYSLCNTQSQCTKNLQYLFVKVTNLPKPVYFGVVYRPPSAKSIGKSIAEFEAILI